VRNEKVKLPRNVILLTLFSFLSMTTICFAGSYSLISKEGLRSQLSKPEIALIDVRPSLGWILSFSKIKGAVREDPDKVQSWVNDYSKDITIMLYCQGQSTSSIVAQALVSAGFQKVYVLKGGWSEWSKAGFPTEKKIDDQFTKTCHTKIMMISNAPPACTAVESPQPASPPRLAFTAAFQSLWRRYSW